MQHGFSVARLGTNTVALRVTDHVMQTHVDSCRVVLTMGQPPVAEIGPDRTVETGWPLDFDGTGSSDDVRVSRYVWNFGDGTTGTGPRPRHIYRSASPTNYTAVLTVYDAVEQASAPRTAQVSVVTGTLPRAETGGPYTAGAGGPPAYFDGSASSDDLDPAVVQGVAKYVWDIDTTVDSDGDGIPDNDVDLIGRRAFHTYADPGTYLCKLTVTDAAGQSHSDTTTVQVMTNLAPHVICVPLHGNPDVPHLVYAGKAVTLKGIARDAGALTYQWDFGDGTTSAVAAVTDQYVIQATHTYIGPPNRSFTARLTVWDAQGLSGSDEYRLVMRPDTASTRAEVAVDEALWWLHKNQNREAGYWNNPTDNRSDYRPAAAAGAVQALLTNGHRPEGDPTEDPYVETVNRGFDYLFSTLQTRAMTSQPYGDPDTNGNGIGLEVYANRGYQQGMVIDAIASTQHMLGMARTGGLPELKVPSTSTS
ncbi:MAG: PKD domain-containing protein [Kiritimatiellia bacterium]